MSKAVKIPVVWLLLVAAAHILLIGAKEVINLSANWTDEMQCPQIVELRCNGTNLRSDRLIWEADQLELVEYIYNSNDTFPVTVPSMIENFNIVIQYAEKDKEEFLSYITSVLTTQSDFILNFKNITCGYKNSKDKTIQVHFNCVDEILNVNDTLEGDICPPGLEFRSIARNVEHIEWYFEEELVTDYTPRTELNQPTNLCENHNSNSILTDLCENGGSLIINEVKTNGSRYDINSSLITTGTYIYYHQYLYIKSGSNSIMQTLSTNFTLSCGPKGISLTSNNTNVDNGTCEGIVEFRCNGTNVKYFQWTYNNYLELSDNYTYSVYDLFPMTQNTSISDVNYTVISADTDNCFADNFNFESMWSDNLGNLDKMSISSIKCISDDMQKQITIECTPSVTAQNPTESPTEYPWYFLSVLDFLPICNVSESTSISQNNLCFGVVGGVVFFFIVILILICCGCIIACYYCERRKERLTSRDNQSQQDKAVTGPSPDSEIMSAPPNGGDCASIDVVPKKPKRKRNVFLKFTKVLQNIRRPRRSGYQLLAEGGENPLRSKKETSKYDNEVENTSSQAVSTKQDQKASEQMESNSLVSLKLLPNAETLSHQTTPLTLQQNPPKRTPSPKRAPSPMQPPSPIQPQSPQPGKIERNEQRKTAESIERERADALSKKIFTDNRQCQKQKDLGSRLQKYWYLRKAKDRKAAVLQFTVKVSKKCPISLKGRDMAVLKELFECLKHPYLLAVHDVACQDDYVSIIQDFVAKGSIRDQMFKVEPLRDWEQKYCAGGGQDPCAPGTVALYAKHVLEAVLMLYDLEFPVVGQIHRGNVFFKDGRYVLGGYENVLLGYRTSLYSQIAKAGLLNAIDVIMFGHMIYEMATGEILPDEQLLLDENHFMNVKDENIKEILAFIFNEKFLKKKDPMRKILSHPFFASIETSKVANNIELTPEGRHLLSTVANVQSNELEETLNTDLDLMAIISKLSGKYSEVEVCPRIGWRPNKVWGRAKSKKYGYGLLSAIEVPHTCPIFVEAGLSAIKTLLKTKENFLVSILDVHHVKINEVHVLVVFQEIFDAGSLKDSIYSSSSWNPWESKYDRGHGLREDEIARIGSQILNVSLALGFMDGGVSSFKLQFLHSGNIFRMKDGFVVGGIENMLLGCRPRDYVKFSDHKECIDTLMFGHLIFELATGRELKANIPTDKDYKAVSSGKIKEILKKIFLDITMSPKEILALGFFQPTPIYFKVQNSSVKLLLEGVRKGKRRNQDDTIGKAKYTIVKMPIKKFRNFNPFKTL